MEGRKEGRKESINSRVSQALLGSNNASKGAQFMMIAHGDRYAIVFLLSGHCQCAHARSHACTFDSFGLQMFRRSFFTSEWHRMSIGGIGFA